MFRKMVLPGLIAYGVLHRCAEWLRASVSDEQPHGPSPLHGTLSHWPADLAHLPPSFPLSTTSLVVWNYRPHMESCTCRNTNTAQVIVL